MMQLDEMARQASTDVKLAVMDLEAPPIGPVKGKQPAQKNSVGWAKPILAFAALFLIAGTAWTLLGGNANVEDTRIANIDDVDVDTDVLPLDHPEANSSTISRFRDTWEGDEEFLFFANEEGNKGFIVVTTENAAPLTDEDLEIFTGTDVRGLPTAFDPTESPRILWIENGDTVVVAVSQTLTSEELLAELQNPGVIAGESADDSDFSYEGSVQYFTDDPYGSHGLDGFNNRFELNGVSSLVVSTFRGSIDFEVLLNSVMTPDEVAVVDLRDGLTGYLFSDPNSEPGEWLVWEEAPGVVAYLGRSSSEISTEQPLVEIANELVVGKAPQADDETRVEGSIPSTGWQPGLYLAPPNHIDFVNAVPSEFNDFRNMSTTNVYASGGEVTLTVSRTDSTNGEALQPRDGSGSFIDGAEIFTGSYDNKTLARYEDPVLGTTIVVSSLLGAEGLVELLMQSSLASPGNTPEGYEFVGQSQRFAPEAAYTATHMIFGYEVSVSPPEATFYNVTTFGGDAAAELAAQRFLVPSFERQIRGGKDSVLSNVFEADDRKQLMWGEQSDVVVILETTPDVPDEQLYAWAEALVEEIPGSTEAGGRSIDEVLTDRVAEIDASDTEQFLDGVENAILYTTSSDDADVCVEVYVGDSPEAEPYRHCEAIADGGEVPFRVQKIYPRSDLVFGDFESALLVIAPPGVAEVRFFGDFPRTTGLEGASAGGEEFRYLFDTGYGYGETEAVNARNAEGERIVRTRIVEVSDLPDLDDAEPGESVEPDEVDRSASDARIDEISAEGHTIFHLKPYDNGGADIFYEANGGTEICVEVVGLDLEPTCVPYQGDAMAEAYFIRTLGDDVDSGERSVMIIRRTDAPVNFESHDPVVVTELADGTQIILGSTINPDDAVLEIDDGIDGISGPIREPADFRPDR